MQLNEDEDRNLSISLKAAFYPEGQVDDVSGGIAVYLEDFILLF